jgi:hypothetical protein
MPKDDCMLKIVDYIPFIPQSALRLPHSKTFLLLPFAFHLLLLPLPTILEKK